MRWVLPFRCSTPKKSAQATDSKIGGPNVGIFKVLGNSSFGDHTGMAHNLSSDIYWTIIFNFSEGKKKKNGKWNHTGDACWLCLWTSFSWLADLGSILIWYIESWLGGSVDIYWIMIGWFSGYIFSHASIHPMASCFGVARLSIHHSMKCLGFGSCTWEPLNSVGFWMSWNYWILAESLCL